MIIFEKRICSKENSTRKNNKIYLSWIFKLFDYLIIDKKKIKNIILHINNPTKIYLQVDLFKFSYLKFI